MDPGRRSPTQPQNNFSAMCSVVSFARAHRCGCNCKYHDAGYQAGCCLFVTGILAYTLLTHRESVEEFAFQHFLLLNPWKFFLYGLLLYVRMTWGMIRSCFIRNCTMLSLLQAD